VGETSSLNSKTLALAESTRNSVGARWFLASHLGPLRCTSQLGGFRSFDGRDATREVGSRAVVPYSLANQHRALATVHGFDEFFGNLNHLNAEEGPQNPDYPPIGLVLALAR
jgi:arylsulfatase A-like enzyme